MLGANYQGVSITNRIIKCGFQCFLNQHIDDNQTVASTRLIECNGIPTTLLNYLI